ncbi:MAG: TRASH domain-containing protein [Nitrososphaerales archaeon]
MLAIEFNSDSPLECAECGVRILNKKYAIFLRNKSRIIYFCCPTCLKNFVNEKVDEKPYNGRGVIKW